MSKINKESEIPTRPYHDYRETLDGRERYIFSNGRRIYSFEMTHDDNFVYLRDPYYYDYDWDYCRLQTGILRIAKSDILYKEKDK